VAVKVFKTEQVGGKELGDMIKEARIMECLHHDHVVNFRGASLKVTHDTSLATVLDSFDFVVLT
jgi:hypothetical protein